MSALVRAACAASLAIGLTAPANAWNLPELNRRLDQNLYQVGTGCSGTLVDVDARLILTAYHCVKTHEKMRVSQFFWDKDGNEASVMYWTKVVASDKKRDVAILQIPHHVGPVAISIGPAEDVPLGAKDYVPLRGSAVYHIGNPRGMYGTVTKGIMSAARSMKKYGFDGNKYFIQYDGGITNGSSGGALYDDNGVFIGITTLVLNGNRGSQLNFMGLAVPMSDVWAVAEESCLADDLGGINPAKCAKATGGPS